MGKHQLVVHFYGIEESEQTSVITGKRKKKKTPELWL